jgi:predicted MFS family arabinose efflux permease
VSNERAATILRFVVCLGVVNLFADLTYEGGRSVTGPFLAQLGATAATISIVSGIGEFFGYTLRAVSGYVADRMRRYWIVVGIGYAINMLSVPAMALAGSWPAAAGLIVAERTGRAIRRPIVQGMLSHARTEVGGGRAFGINESLDALGATVGPLVLVWVLAHRGSYRAGFATLLVSALLCLAMLAATRRAYPAPEAFETDHHGHSGPWPASYWLYLAGGAVIGFGFVDFSLIAFHLQHTGVLAAEWVPATYAIAMGTGVIGNWTLGAWYDRAGVPVIVGAFLLGALFTPLVFWGGPVLTCVGMGLWGLNKGAQDTLLKPAIAPLIDAGRRTTAFGIFDTVFGTAWLAGSIALGLLYHRSLGALVAVSVGTQILAVPVFVLASRMPDRTRVAGGS